MASPNSIIVLHVQDVETVVGDISRGMQQPKNLSDVTLVKCCDELTRGVVEDIVVNQCIQKFTLDTRCIRFKLFLRCLLSVFM